MMSIWKPGRTLVLTMTLAALACGGSEAATRSSATPASNACDGKLLTLEEVAAVLGDPVTGTKPIPGDGQSCEFTTAGFASVTVTLRPGQGKETLAVWKSGKMPISGVPLAGVGEEAVWVGALTEVVAERNDLLCDVQVNGGMGVPHNQPTGAKQEILGGLCNKIFSAVR